MCLAAVTRKVTRIRHINERGTIGPLKNLVISEGYGGCSRIRTYDPLIKSQLLYQLSYAPVSTKRAQPDGEGAEHSRKATGRKGRN